LTSPTQTRFGAAASKFLSTRLGATGCRCRESVVVLKRLRGLEAIRLLRMILATRLAPMGRPDARSSSAMRGDP